ncbi:MAG: hypothetical protein KAT47_03505 [Candidatus Aegiribacteria sp.]|nr:hypothetical protein [Candidatus Aegiribacteria sp.]
MIVLSVHSEQVIETTGQNLYIYLMMKRLSVILYISTLLISIGSAQAQQLSDSYLDVIVNLDREMAGLLDAYLEAVPECPITPETPVRVWVLDVAWLRASAALSTAETLDIHSISSVDVSEAWTGYLHSSQQYLNVFRIIQKTYHKDILPENHLSIELEDQLLEYDSLWSLEETVFFELLAEEEIL